MKKQLLLIILMPVLIYSCKAKNKNLSVIAGKATAIDTAESSCPYLTKDNKNNIVLSWVRKLNDSSYVFCYAISKDDGKTFGKPVEIPGSTNIHPHAENLPKIVFKPSGEIITAWGASNPNPANPYAGLVYYSQSFDDGKTWTKAKVISPDTASFDQRYFDISLLPNGEAAMVWLDNRKRWKREGSGLYYAVTKNNTGFQNEKLISGPCCECCRTDLFVDKEDAIHIAYRAIINDSIRDMVHIVSSNNGKTFSSPQRISKDNWVINGCPHTGPAMAENKNGMFFTWFTGGMNAGTYCCGTADGKTFTNRNLISGRTAKHSQVISLSTESNVIVWDEGFSNGKAFNNLIGLEYYNTKGNTIKNYITSKTGNAAFPVIYALSDRKVIVAYSEMINNKTQVFYKEVAFR